MEHKQRVPDAVSKRLPGYYRNLLELEAQGVVRVSSSQLALLMNATASQVRQDMNWFGGFGQQGYGYHVQDLKRHLGDILGLTKTHHMVLVGAGNIGRAVAHYPTFWREGFHLEAIFDADPHLIGTAVSGLTVRSIATLETYLQAHPIELVIIATPAAAAQPIADLAVEAGVLGIWNFAPVDLTVPTGVEVANVHLSDSLFSLSFRVHERQVNEHGGWHKGDTP